MLVVVLLARDLRARLRDRSALVLAVLAPVALITVLSLLVSGPDVEETPVGFAGSSAPVSQALVDGPLAALSSDGTLTVTPYDDEGALRAAVTGGDVEAGIAVADDGTVTVLTDPGAPVAGAIAESLARSAAVTVDAVGQAVAAERLLGREADPAALAARLAAQQAGDPRSTDQETTATLDTRTQIAAGMATFFLFFTVQFGVLGLLEEKRRGTLPRLLAAPVPAWQVLAAKVLVSLVLGLVSMTVLLVFATVALGAAFGSPLGVALLVAGGVLAAVATVSLVAGVARSAEQAGALQAGVALVLGILGGAFFSLARAGGLAAWGTRLTPHYWFNEGLVHLTGGQPWTSALPAVAALLAFALVVGLPGLVLASRTVRP